MKKKSKDDIRSLEYSLSPTAHMFPPKEQLISQMPYEQIVEKIIKAYMKDGLTREEALQKMQGL